jgi:Flp pilus assembly pilin Flp
VQAKRRAGSEDRAAAGALYRLRTRESKEVTQMLLFLSYLRARVAHEAGQTMAEYAVVLAVVTLLVLGALTALSGGISNALTNVKAILP